MWEEPLLSEPFCPSFADGGEEKAGSHNAILALSAKEWEGASEAKGKAELRHSPVLSACPYRQSGSRVQRRPLVPSPRARALPFARGYLPWAHQSQQVDDDLRQQTVCPRGSYLFSSQGRNLALTAAQGFQISLSLWWKSP